LASRVGDGWERVAENDKVDTRGSISTGLLDKRTFEIGTSLSLFEKSPVGSLWQ
jgi:hypothetical protein